MKNFDYKKSQQFLEEKERQRQRCLDENVFSLKSELNKNRSVLKQIVDFYDNFIKNEFLSRQGKTESALIISDLICNYYTCLETIFLRISQFFENDLSPAKWQQRLLEMMALEIEEIRPQVIRNENYATLRELMEFRDFKWNYFELDYDWDKLEFVQKKFEQAVQMVEADLKKFDEFLESIKNRRKNAFTSRRKSERSID